MPVLPMKDEISNDMGIWGSVVLLQSFLITSCIQLLCRTQESLARVRSVDRLTQELANVTPKDVPWEDALFSDTALQMRSF